MVISLERGADLHMAQLMPLPLIVSCFSKIQIGFTFLVPAHLGSPGKGPLNGCVYYYKTAVIVTLDIVSSCRRHQRSWRRRSPTTAGPCLPADPPIIMISPHDMHSTDAAYCYRCHDVPYRACCSRQCLIRMLDIVSTPPMTTDPSLQTNPRVITTFLTQ